MPETSIFFLPVLALEIWNSLKNVWYLNVWWIVFCLKFCFLVKFKKKNANIKNSKVIASGPLAVIPQLDSGCGPNWNYFVFFQYQLLFPFIFILLIGQIWMLPFGIDAHFLSIASSAILIRFSFRQLITGEYFQCISILLNTSYCTNLHSILVYLEIFLSHIFFAIIHSS